jgi:hypothetical protein
MVGGSARAALQLRTTLLGKLHKNDISSCVLVSATLHDLMRTSSN